MKQLVFICASATVKSRSTGLGKEVYDGFNIEWQYDIAAEKVSV